MEEVFAVAVAVAEEEEDEVEEDAQNLDLAQKREVLDVIDKKGFVRLGYQVNRRVQLRARHQLPSGSLCSVKLEERKTTLIHIQPCAVLMI